MSVAHSLVAGWIRSVSAFTCPSERCTAPLQTRAMSSGVGGPRGLPLTAQTREADSRPSLIPAGSIDVTASPKHCIPRVSAGKHAQRQQKPEKGSRALYPDGIP